MVIVDAPLDAAGDDHGSGLAADLSLSDDLLVKVADHHIRLFRDGERLAFHKGAQLLLRLLLVEHWVIFHNFFEPVIAVDGRVVFQHVQNETFLNSLLHGVDVERPMLHLALLIENRVAIGVDNQGAEGFQRFVLRRGCKGKIAGICEQLFALAHGVDLVLVVHVRVGHDRG